MGLPMSPEEPETDCFDLAFQASYPIGDSAQAALEQYAQALANARGAQALRADDDPVMVRGVRVCGLGTTFHRILLADIEDFARRIATSGENDTNLDWSC